MAQARVKAYYGNLLCCFSLRMQHSPTCKPRNVNQQQVSDNFTWSLAGLFPAGRPNFRNPDDLKRTCPSVDPAYQSVLRLNFPEGGSHCCSSFSPLAVRTQKTTTWLVADYKDAQQRCQQIAHALADRHPNENILLVFTPSALQGLPC